MPNLFERYRLCGNAGVEAGRWKIVQDSAVLSERVLRALPEEHPRHVDVRLPYEKVIAFVAERPMLALEKALWKAHICRSIGRGSRQCLVNGVDQQGTWKRLMQIGDASRLHRVCFHCTLFESRDENYRKLGTGIPQSSLQLYPGHTAEINIQHEAFNLARGVAAQKCLGGRIFLGQKAIGIQQPPDAPAHARIVFHDSHYAWWEFQFCASLQPAEKATGSIDDRAVQGSPILS